MHRVILALLMLAGFAGFAPGIHAIEELDTHILELPGVGPEPAKAFPLRLIDSASRPVPWDKEGVRWMLIRVAATQRNLDAAPLDEKGQPTAILDLSGVGVIGVDLKPRNISVDGMTLRKWIEGRGTMSPGADIPRGATDVRLRRVESFKLVVRCGALGAEAGASEATGKTGQEAEIRPLMDPLALRIPSTLPVRAYSQGAPLAGARLIARHVPTGRTVECRADASGIGQFSLDAAGQWRLEFHSLTAAPAGEDPALILHSATLAFEAPAPVPAGGGR